MPLIHALRTKGMHDRHWEQISNSLKLNVRPSPTFTLSSAIDMGLLDHIEQIQEVSELASKEFGIEMALKKMQEDWIPLKLEVYCI